MAEFFGSRLRMPADGLVPTMLAAAAGGVIKAGETRWLLYGGNLATTLSEGLRVLEEAVGTGLGTRIRGKDWGSNNSLSQAFRPEETSVEFGVDRHAESVTLCQNSEPKEGRITNDISCSSDALCVFPVTRAAVPWALLILAWIGLVVASMAALASVPTPTVSVPPAGGKGFPFFTSSIDLASFGYTESEFFISGDAQAFVNSGPLGNDGVWNVSPGAIAPYMTRMLVRAPAEPERFNGTVVVEWINVTGGVDATPEWDYAHVELLREGYAWVGVSAQFVGAEFLKIFDPVRYASISHPGDSWSYDIFSQAGMAILHGHPRPLGALTPLVRTVLAAGESQSAFRMFTYYNAIQPLAGVYQGFLIHSTGSGSALSQSFAGGGIGSSPIPAPPGVPKTPDIAVPPTAFVRVDLHQPVLFLNTETDVTFLGAGFSVHNQPDSRTFRMWEVTGTTHADAYLLEFAGAMRRSPV